MRNTFYAGGFGLVLCAFLMLFSSWTAVDLNVHADPADLAHQLSVRYDLANASEAKIEDILCVALEKRHENTSLVNCNCDYYLDISELFSELCDFGIQRFCDRADAADNAYRTCLSQCNNPPNTGNTGGGTPPASDCSPSCPPGEQCMNGRCVPL